MRFEVTILGSSSAIPTKDRFPTSQLVNFYNKYYLIDCGEGTQIQLRKYKLSMQRISAIFISHAHADHFLGLPGLLSTMDLLGRQAELKIYAPEEVIQYINAYCQIIQTGFRFQILKTALNMQSKQTIVDEPNLTIQSFPLKHSIPCLGFIFKEKQNIRNIKKETLKKYRLSIDDIKSIKDGNNYQTESGEVISNEELTLPMKNLRSYAYCTDTAYYPEIAEDIQNANLLYHEATFLEKLRNRAHQTKHSTAKEAGMIAKAADVKKLIIGHYSVRYENPEVLLEEAKTIFPNTELALEGKRFIID